MQLLIDTQIFIWAVTENENLSAQAREIMLNASGVFVSAASIWEIAIKARLGRLEGDPNEFVAAIEQSGFRALAISADHAAMVYELPFHHRDPFDRLLIAQALSEPLRLLTTDKMLSQYSDLVITTQRQRTSY
jgi:PIN domain nuclease of toxin-antitoxin system